MKESDILPLKRIVFTRIAAKLPAKCLSKPACITETCHVCDLDHRVLTALHQRQAPVDTVFFQISGNCLACHFFEQTAADLSGKMNLICQFLQRDDRLKMCIKIIQHLLQSFQLKLVGRNEFCEFFLMFTEDQTVYFTEKTFDLQFIAVGLLIKDLLDLVELLYHLLSAGIFFVQKNAGNRRILQKRTETVALHIASEFTVYKIRTCQKGAVSGVAVVW